MVKVFAHGPGRESTSATDIKSENDSDNIFSSDNSPARCDEPGEFDVSKQGDNCTVAGCVQTTVRSQIQTTADIRCAAPVDCCSSDDPQLWRKDRTPQVLQHQAAWNDADAWGENCEFISPPSYVGADKSRVVTQRPYRRVALLGEGGCDTVFACAPAWSVLQARACGDGSPPDVAAMVGCSCD
eukprot:TRINITY_DN13980_c0_g1_i1.p1 TRINITY_DN13980_c0_g1~~TRINITY_DN13980_c0_g1_i1.p1  ORF type:complete len:184 (-),score=9.61 TRINITY_DN13980_c0_g1_i1:150-701(-)